MTITPGTPQLVIFDCDGVLVDSEMIFNRVLHTIISEYGATLTFEESCARFIGTNIENVGNYLTSIGVDLAKDWSDALYERAYHALEKDVQPVPGIQGVLRDLTARQVAFCVASNGQTAKMNTTLGTTGMLPLFRGRMYSAYEVGQSKPAPDVFLAAARANDTAPGQCVVIEDSATGLEAAHNASMRCYAYVPKGHQPPANLFGATRFAQMGDLPGLLGIS